MNSVRARYSLVAAVDKLSTALTLGIESDAFRTVGVVVNGVIRVAGVFLD